MDWIDFSLNIAKLLYYTKLSSIVEYPEFKLILTVQHNIKLHDYCEINAREPFK